ncbi:MAG: hypothetical protein K9G49_09745 [Taibaiella sp.]|nr:hypothetical protein [Taibaiella sp.]
MKKYTLLSITAISAFMIASCGDAGNGKNGAAVADSVAAPAGPAPTLSAVSPSPEYDGASLTISDVKAEKVSSDSTKLTFKFTVKNFELKMQTADNGNKLCNNSAQGQHIHFIMDTQPYKALYEPKNEITILNGTEHYLVVFLSRSYHESVKSPGAAALYHFRLSENGKLEKLDLPETPMVFYSRPKGDYLGKDTANILLDFYVWNGGLGADSFKVNATLNPAGSAPEDAISFIIDKWESKFINKLPMGKSKLTLTLLNKEGVQVDGPCTSATREFNLGAQEPMK